MLRVAGLWLFCGIADVIEGKGSKGFQIIIREIPYQVNKATMLEHLADLVKRKEN